MRVFLNLQFKEQVTDVPRRTFATIHFVGPPNSQSCPSHPISGPVQRTLQKLQLIQNVVAQSNAAEL